MGGRFRVANILFDSKVSDNSNVIQELQLTCSNEIVWLMIDVTKSDVVPSWKNNNYPIDSVYQVVLTDQFDDKILQRFPVYYRLFVFHSMLIDGVDRGHSVSGKIDFNTNSLALFQNALNGSVEFRFLRQDLSIFNELTITTNQMDFNQLFDLTHGKREEMRTFGAFLPIKVCELKKKLKNKVFDRVLLLMNNLFFDQTKMSFIEKVREYNMPILYDNNMRNEQTVISRLGCVI